MTVPEGVLIAIPTFRRVDLLARLLETLPAAVDGVEVSVRAIVFDNDCDPRVARLVRAHHAHRSVPLDYLAVPEGGIPAVRNAALRSARGYEYLAFVDDDEELPRRWLRSHLAALTRFGADVVAGPVLPRPSQRRPAWLRDLSAYRVAEPRLPLGGELPWCATNNTVARTRALGDLSFDERYRDCGGSDNHFFFRVELDGARIVWNPEAAVTELIPPDRMKIGWILRRSFRGGAIRTKIRMDVLGPGPWVAVQVTKAVGNLAVGATQLVSGLLRRSAPTALRGSQRMSSGLGACAGFFGLAGHEYRSDGPGGR